MTEGQAKDLGTEPDPQLDYKYVLIVLGDFLRSCCRPALEALGNRNASLGVCSHTQIENPEWMSGPAFLRSCRCPLVILSSSRPCEPRPKGPSSLELGVGVQVAEDVSTQHKTTDDPEVTSQGKVGGSGGGKGEGEGGSEG